MRLQPPQMITIVIRMIFIKRHATDLLKDPSPTTNPSTTIPKPSNQETSSSSTIVTTSKSYIRTLSEITSSSAVPVVAVTSSGNAVYTYTSTSYSIFSTSVPTMIEANQFASPSTVSSGAIAGIVVGCVAFVGLLGK